jgi:hypothetical protein
MIAVLEFFLFAWVLFMLIGVIVVMTHMMASALTDIFRGD